MITATVRQFRGDCAALLRKVERGQRIAITRKGRTVAVLAPPPADPVDWKESAALGLTHLRPINKADRKTILEENRGRF